MAKCMICREPAMYKIKDHSDYYCEECAKENFSDIDLLQSVEEQAKIIKEQISNRKDEEEIE